MSSKYQELFNLLSDEHELALLESEMEEISTIVDKINKRDLLVDNNKLREILWLRHGCSFLYGDDGEMQCSHCLIDFKRDSPKRIAQRFADIGKNILETLKDQGFTL